MRLLNLLANQTGGDFLNDIIGFLESHLGSKLMAWVTVGIIIALAFALVICTLIAIFSPSKRKLKKLKKTLKVQEEYDLTRQRIFELSEEIGTVSLEMRIIKKQCEDDVFNLSELEKSAFHQDILYIENVKHQMGDIAEKQAILNEVLKEHQKGLMTAVKKEKAESAKLLMNELAIEQRKYHNEIYWKNVDIEKRKAQLLLDIENLNFACNEKQKELSNKLHLLENEKAHLEAKLAKMDKKGRHKLTLADARAMTDEFAKRKRLADKLIEDQALEELKIAKAEYEEAYRQRVLAEKNKNLAVENVKAMQKDLSKTKSNRPVKYTQLTEASAVVSGDKPDDVNIIIADINSEAVFTPVIVEEALVTDDTQHSYEEPTLEVVDIADIPEEDVVFILAELDFPADEDEEDIKLDEAAVSEDLTDGSSAVLLEKAQEPDCEPIIEIKVESDTSNDKPLGEQKKKSFLDKEEEVSEPEKKSFLDKAELKTENLSFTEETSTDSDEQKTGSALSQTDLAKAEDVVSPKQSAEIIEKARTYPAYKDYNDGIPATPLHKKTKFSKPVTKLVKKAKSTDEAPSFSINLQQTEQRVAYCGKWKIEEDNGKFYAKLFASNGGLLLTTPHYTAVNGVKACIENVKESLMADNVTITTDKEGKFFFKVLSTSKRTILQSSKHTSKYQCEKSLASAKRFAKTAVTV
ncbi:MAG: DUF1508 domain-containing protein [Clostridia bacterium]|nr:DUF1508 domain-containing protein [Clostridia bacterium]